MEWSFEGEDTKMSTENADQPQEEGSAAGDVVQRVADAIRGRRDPPVPEGGAHPSVSSSEVQPVEAVSEPDSKWEELERRMFVGAFLGGACVQAGPEGLSEFVNLAVQWAFYAQEQRLAADDGPDGAQPGPGAVPGIGVPPGSVPVQQPDPVQLQQEQLAQQQLEQQQLLQLQQQQQQLQAQIQQQQQLIQQAQQPGSPAQQQAQQQAAAEHAQRVQAAQAAQRQMIAQQGQQNQQQFQQLGPAATRGVANGGIQPIVHELGPEEMAQAMSVQQQMGQKVRVVQNGRVVYVAADSPQGQEAQMTGQALANRRGGW